MAGWKQRYQKKPAGMTGGKTRCRCRKQPVDASVSVPSDHCDGHDPFLAPTNPVYQFNDASMFNIYIIK